MCASERARTHACMHARTHARTHARMHARTHARTHACVRAVCVCVERTRTHAPAHTRAPIRRTHVMQGTQPHIHSLTHRVNMCSHHVLIGGNTTLFPELTRTPAAIGWRHRISTWLKLGLPNRSNPWSEIFRISLQARRQGRCCSSDRSQTAP